MQAASAIATCGSSASTCGPPRSSELMMGRISNAEDEAISTAYRAAFPVPKTAASPTPRTADPAPTSTARAMPRPRLRRRLTSRTGTWVPARNITSPKPTSARNVNVGSEASRYPTPVVPRRIPTRSSPRTTGTCQPRGYARSGPTRPARTTTASTAKFTGHLQSASSSLTSAAVSHAGPHVPACRGRPSPDSDKRTGKRTGSGAPLRQARPGVTAVRRGGGARRRERPKRAAGPPAPLRLLTPRSAPACRRPPTWCARRPGRTCCGRDGCRRR